MFQSSKGHANPDVQSKDTGKICVAIVQARFNSNITFAMRGYCEDALYAAGILDGHSDTFEVPGALEIPVALQALAEYSRYDALIAIGCIIRGETYHFELVANESAHGIGRIAMDYEIPVINAVLTVENQTQAQARMQEKAIDAAQAAIEMAQLITHLA